MRTREEIMYNVINAVSDKDKTYWRVEGILEVLLDIRELLQPITRKRS